MKSIITLLAIVVMACFSTGCAEVKADNKKPVVLGGFEINGFHQERVNPFGNDGLVQGLVVRDQVSGERTLLLSNKVGSPGFTKSILPAVTGIGAQVLAAHEGRSEVNVSAQGGAGGIATSSSHSNNNNNATATSRVIEP
jgi:hypothetical protein